jgi:hypothetical protein
MGGSRIGKIKRRGAQGIGRQRGPGRQVGGGFDHDALAGDTREVESEPAGPEPGRAVPHKRCGAPTFPRQLAPSFPPASAMPIGHQTIFTDRTLTAAWLVAAEASAGRPRRPYESNSPRLRERRILLRTVSNQLPPQTASATHSAPEISLTSGQNGSAPRPLVRPDPLTPQSQRPAIPSTSENSGSKQPLARKTPQTVRAKLNFARIVALARPRPPKSAGASNSPNGSVVFRSSICFWLPRII